jgi:biotin synthase
MKTGTRKNIAAVLDSVLAGQSMDRVKAFELAEVKGADLWDVLAAAGRIRDHFRGNTVDLCSIVNAKSGECSEDCKYCAQSVHHSTGAPVYPLIDVEQMAEAALSAKKNGAKRFCIVTSGRGIESQEDLENIAAGIRRVRETGLSPCATLGTLSRDQLSRLKEAGLHRYHHNIETSKGHFPRICSTHNFEERLEVLQNVRGLGLSACSGGILGMGETMQDRIEMAFTLRELDVDSVPLNFLMPVPGTPLACIKPILPLEALHAIAVFRFILPDKEIRICGGRGTALGLLHPLIFLAGADGFMIGNYLTQNGLNPQTDLQMVRDLGLHF